MLQAELRALAGVRAEDTVTSAAVYEPGVLRASKVLPLWHWLSVLGLLSLRICLQMCSCNYLTTFGEG